MVTPVVVNGTLNVVVQQMKDSPFTIILALATLALAIITGIKLWKSEQLTRKSNEETKRSNDLYRMELVERLRPSIVIVNRELEYSRATEVVKLTPNFNNNSNLVSNLKNFL